LIFDFGFEKPLKFAISDWERRPIGADGDVTTELPVRLNDRPALSWSFVIRADDCHEIRIDCDAGRDVRLDLLFRQARAADRRRTGSGRRAEHTRCVVAVSGIALSHAAFDFQNSIFELLREIPGHLAAAAAESAHCDD